MSMLFKRIKDWATSITEFRTVDVMPVDGPRGTAKITFSNLTAWVHNKWAAFVHACTAITSFASGDFIAVSNPTDGTRKMSKDTLLQLTSQNALAGNVAQAFDPTRDENYPYNAGEKVVYDGKTYIFKRNHYGAWDASDVVKYVSSELLDKVNYSLLNGGEIEYEGTEDGYGVVIYTCEPEYQSVNISRSSYIVCFGAKTITFLDMVNVTSGVRIGYAFYDRFKNIITGNERSSGDSQGAKERIVDVPDGAYYFRSSYWSSTKRDELGLGEYYAKVQYDGVAKNKDVREIETCIKSEDVVIIQKLDATDTFVMLDNVVNIITGIIGESENFNVCVFESPKMAQFIKTPFRFRTQDTRLSGVGFYDENDHFISGEGTCLFNSASDNYGIVEIPQGTKKIAVSISKDLDISDVEFIFYRSNGRRKATTIYYGNNDCCNGYFAYTEDGTLSISWSYNFGMFEKIPCKGAYKLTAKIPVFDTPAGNGIVFYDEQGVYISARNRSQGTLGSEVVNVIVPTNAAFVSVLSWNYDKQANYGTPYVELHYMGEVSLPKREKKNGQIHFSVIVDQSVTDWWVDDGDMNSPSLAKSTCVLTLPDDYTPNGKPSKLMVWCHGNSRNVSLAQWGLNNTEYLEQKERFRAAGYAVLDCNGPCDDRGNAVSYVGCPQGVMAYLKAIRFVVENYNLDPIPYIVGASAGGLTASSLATIIPSKCLCYMSPNLSHYSWWEHNSRNPFVLWFGFTDSVTWEQDKAVGWDAKGKIVNNAIPAIFPPVMLFVGDAEVNGVFWQDMQDVIVAIRAGGGYAGLHICKNADHGITNGQFPAVDQQVIDWLDRF